MNTNEIKIRKCQIVNNQHQEWGTWGVMEDKGDWYEIMNDRGSFRILFKDELENGTWDIVS